jgi:hypothetical protein
VSSYQQASIGFRKKFEPIRQAGEPPPKSSSADRCAENSKGVYNAMVQGSADSTYGNTRAAALLEGIKEWKFR